MCIIGFCHRGENLNFFSGFSKLVISYVKYEYANKFDDCEITDFLFLNYVFQKSWDSKFSKNSSNKIDLCMVRNITFLSKHSLTWSSIFDHNFDFLMKISINNENFIFWWNFRFLMKNSFFVYESFNCSTQIWILDQKFDFWQKTFLPKFQFLSQRSSLAKNIIFWAVHKSNLYFCAGVNMW